jgi:hypothetical protein
MLANLYFFHILPPAYSHPPFHIVILLRTLPSYSLCGLHKTFFEVFCLHNLHTHHYFGVFCPIRQWFNDINVMIHLSYWFFL